MQVCIGENISHAANLLSCSVRQPLATIYAHSLEERVVPKDWRCANVTPIFKKGSKSLAGNYRPVSLTCILCKVMESIIRDAIVKHLAENKLLLPSQHGFMKAKLIQSLIILIN